jgi:hypothetical protein
LKGYTHGLFAWQASNRPILFYRNQFTLTTEPTNALVYQVTQQLTTTCTDQFVLTSDDSDFDVEEYAKAGFCTVALSPHPMPLIEYAWWNSEQIANPDTVQGRWNVFWEGDRFDLLQICWNDTSGCRSTHRWLIADTQEAGERFFAAVCTWNAEVRPEEVMVFASGYWQKSEALYHAISNATFDNLILPVDLRRELQDDLQQFFASRAVYERYRIPWKRGLLLVGPPGNGKTHAIKALVNWLRKPCFYVKSLKANHMSDHDTIKRVFDRARETTPCLLIMEDLDSLITDRNRSFFLNELDGFAANTGIVLIATTNHPERLDTAIVDRPSRFDRKYHFMLPAPAERTAYITHWNTTLEPELQLSETGVLEIVAATDGFSYAYLKELFLSSMMRWINTLQPGVMDRVMSDQCQILCEQMNSAPLVPIKEAPDIDEDEDT